MNADFRLWNPKAKAWATVQVRATPRVRDMHHLIYARREGAEHNGWHYDGQAEGAIFLCDSTDDYLRVGVRDATNPWGQGWGLTLYLGMAVAAGCMGFKGVYSVPDYRSPYAARVWEAMLASGLARREGLPPQDLLDASAVGDLYRFTAGVKLACP